MPNTTAIPGRTKNGGNAHWRRFEVAKYSVAFLAGLLLFYAGHRGREQARLQAGLNELGLLSRRLDQGEGAGNTAALLKAKLLEFNSKYGPGDLSEGESLELRLSKATLANVESRFAEAAALVTDEDERRAAGQQNGWVRLLQIRGDAFYGLQKWEDALDRYRRILVREPDRVEILARIAKCQEALGRKAEAISISQALAASHSDRGRSLLLQEKPEAARGQFKKATGILIRLVEKEGRSDLAGELARSHNDLGNVLFIQEKPADAIADYESALAILAPLVEAGGWAEWAEDFAACHHNRGNALLALGKLEPALGHFEKAIEILTRLIENEGRTELSSDLAACHNHRGIVRRAQGKLDAAIEDFETAIGILSPLIEQSDQSESEKTHAGSTRVKLNAAIGFSEKTLDVFTRAVRIGDGTSPAIALATTLKNRGYAHLVQGKLPPAIQDFEKAREIYARLVGQEGQQDLVLQFTTTLSQLAWIFATHPDDLIRDGAKAKEYALKACELTGWRGSLPLETLAAACAETGDFADAVKWQERVLQLAPAAQQNAQRSRLELYKSGKPYRTAQAQ